MVAVLRISLIAICLSITCFARQSPGSEFMAGADISALPVLEQAGATYRDDGVAGDAIGILRNNGINWFRLRLFVDPSASSDPFVVNDLNYTIALAQRAKATGAKVLLDLHYSDTWADPGHQSKPAAWNSLSFTSLTQRVHDYTRDALAAFKNANVLPEMVQIGNEISNGMLWNSGYVWTGGTHNTGFNNLATLLSAGISGAKDGAGAGQEPLIMIHHDKGADWNTSSYFFQKLVDRSVDFDVIGYSYYPKWHYNPSTGAGDIADLHSNFNNTAATFGKPVVLVETGFPSRGAQFEPDYEFDVSQQGQQQFLETVIGVVQQVPNDLGQGVFWWYPEARPVTGLSVWEGGRYGLFDQNGNLLPAASEFAAIATPIPGDFNNDGSVDAADYVAWSKTGGSPDDYATWRSRFGQTVAGGASTLSAPSLFPAVPEPACAWVLLSGLTVVCCRALRIHSRAKMSANVSAP
jgi:arabinogalactan endo-1,4-beta-galactosidase